MDSVLFALFIYGQSLSEVKTVQFSCAMKENRLFRRTYRKGESAVGPYLVLYCAQNGTKENRLGLTVSAKNGCAVERNRVRRRLREIYRLGEARLKCGYDLVIVVRTRGMAVPYAKLESSFFRLAAQLGLLREDAK